MKKFCLMLCFIGLGDVVQCQDMPGKLRAAVQELLQDSQLRHAQIGFVVFDATKAREVYSYQREAGLAAASTQKLFTAIAALELLGPDYRYQTSFSIDTGQAPALQVNASGDPTLGSDRWPSTNEGAILTRIRIGLKTWSGRFSAPLSLRFSAGKYSSPLVPEGWIWQDIGNYYGAGSHPFNWRENQFDVFFKTGSSVGDNVSVSGLSPAYLDSLHFDVSALKTAAKGSGDNGYLFFDVWKNNAYSVSGTLPAGEERFSLSAAHPDPRRYFSQMLRSNGLEVILADQPIQLQAIPVYTHCSPRLDSIVYWFLQKSINLYGEALLATIAAIGSTQGLNDNGPDALRAFWKARGIDEASLHVLDGSGLSPQNRVTPLALVTALMYARQQPWFASLYTSLPMINGQHMKSGSIEGARAYAGYQQAADGSQYVFAVIVNNYDGSSSQVTRKLWKLLDLLK